MIYLASQSPRRRELLEQIGVEYQVTPVSVNETPLPDESAREYVLRIAQAKAHAAQRQHGPHPVLGSDTTVEVDGRILSKPANKADGMGMLLALSGKTHRVLTAVVIAGAKEHWLISESLVSMRVISAQEAEAYWATGEPADKAGGYAVQGMGAIFISRISGSYSGVMGLPLYETASLLEKEGIQIFRKL